MTIWPPESNWSKAVWLAVMFVIIILTAIIINNSVSTQPSP